MKADDTASYVGAADRKRLYAMPRKTAAQRVVAFLTARGMLSRSLVGFGMPGLHPNVIYTITGRSLGYVASGTPSWDLTEEDLLELAYREVGGTPAELAEGVSLGEDLGAEAVEFGEKSVRAQVIDTFWVGALAGFVIKPMPGSRLYMRHRCGWESLRESPGAEYLANVVVRAIGHVQFDCPERKAK